jgi:pimeloyl-ACP methyl ester carboxylesterase
MNDALLDAVPLAAARTESSDGCPIAYWTGGNRKGPAIVLLHGYALDHTVWLPALLQGGLLDGFHVVVPDLRGHGASGHPLAAAGYLDGRLWADDLNAVLRSSGVARPVVAAWSYGARMVFDYIRHYGAASLGGLNLVAAASLADPSVLGPAHGCLAALCSPEAAEADAAGARFLGEILGLEDGGAMHQRLAAALGRTTLQQRRWLRERALDYDQLIAGLELPVLVTHGMRDPVLLPGHAGNLMRKIAFSQVSFYGESGHAPFLDEPQRYGRELGEFAARAARRA